MKGKIKKDWSEFDGEISLLGGLLFFISFEKSKTRPPFLFWAVSVFELRLSFGLSSCLSLLFL